MTTWRDILDPLGWPMLERASPLYAASLAARMTPTGGLIAGSAPAARKAAADMRNLGQLLLNAANGMQAIDQAARRDFGLSTQVIRHAMAARSGLNLPYPELGTPDPVGEAINAVWEVMAAVEIYVERLEKEGGEAKRGNQSNRAARNVAGAIADLWLFTFGELPTLGRRADGRGLSCPYGQAVEAVLSAVGIACADAYRPARDARDALVSDPERINTLRQLRHPTTQHLPKIELRK